MAKKVTNVAIAVPFGIIGSISMCGIFGFILMVIIAGTMNPGVVATLSPLTGQPVAQIHLDVLGNKWVRLLKSNCYIL